MITIINYYYQYIQTKLVLFKNKSSTKLVLFKKNQIILTIINDIGYHHNYYLLISINFFKKFQMILETDKTFSNPS